MAKTYNKNNLNQHLSDVGRLPPQALELEESILGAMMLEAECLPIIMDILTPNSFYKESHRLIYGAISSLFKQSYPVDIKTIVEELKKTGDLEKVGGAYGIVELTNSVASSAHAEFHARIVQQKFIQRELIRIGTETINASYQADADCFDLMEGLEKSLTALTGNFKGSTVKTMPKLWNELIEKNDILLKAEGLNGVPSGFKDIDKVTGGWQAGNSIILAARPAMGKTALAINFACNAAIKFNKPVAIFSLEMNALELFTRMASSESWTSNNKFNRKGIEAEDMYLIQTDCAKLINSPLYVDDSAGLTLQELRSKARKLKREKGIELIVIDYLQLMEGASTNKGNREQDVSTISRGIKNLAKELEIPIISLSQLSRAVESRGGEKRPQLSDLRESGSIEQDADVVMFLHRPEYYGIKEDDRGLSTAGVAEIIYQKNRNGPAQCSDYLKFINYLTKFTDEDYSAIAPATELKQPIKSSDPNKYIEPNTSETVHV